MYLFGHRRKGVGGRGATCDPWFMALLHISLFWCAYFPFLLDLGTWGRGQIYVSLAAPFRTALGPSGLLDFVLWTHRALRPRDPRSFYFFAFYNDDSASKESILYLRLPTVSLCLNKWKLMNAFVRRRLSFTALLKKINCPPPPKKLHPHKWKWINWGPLNQMSYNHNLTPHNLTPGILFLERYFLGNVFAARFGSQSFPGSSPVHRI